MAENTKTDELRLKLAELTIKLSNELQHNTVDELLRSREPLQNAFNELQELFTQYGIQERIDEATLLEKRAGDKFEELCRAVEKDPNLGNSSKGKKDNFLDGAESMLLVPSIRKAELTALKDKQEKKR